MDPCPWTRFSERLRNRSFYKPKPTQVLHDDEDDTFHSVLCDDHPERRLNALSRLNTIREATWEAFELTVPGSICLYLILFSALMPCLTWAVLSTGDKSHCGSLIGWNARGGGVNLTTTQTENITFIKILSSPT